jgi:beta-glucosidase
MKVLKIFFVLALGIAGADAQPTFPYKNPALSVEERVKDLLSRMTPEEKFWQLYMIPGDLDNLETPDQYKNGIFGFQVSASSKSGDETGQILKYNTNEDARKLARKINSIQRYFVEKTRLGIPIIAFDESLHGLVREGATSFPQSIGLASTFDTAIVREVAAAIAIETKSRGIRQILSPVINIASDVRWGRVEETYGEDPFLTSAMAVAYVSAFEKRGIITTPKHLIANVGDGGRDSYPIHLNERFIEEIHFPPFKACFTLGGTRSVMTSYNSYDGVACTANNWILNKKLKEDWNFQGFVISDANAMGGSVVLHNTAANFKEAARQAISGGLDVIFQTDYNHHKLFSESLLNPDRDTKRIDDAVTRVLRAKFQLGLFESPYVDENASALTSNNHKALARKAAQESIVLLKNSSSTLPLKRSLKTIAVFGEDAVEARLGGYSGPGNGKVSIVDGLRARANVNVLYAEGCKRMEQQWTVIPSSALSTGKTKGLSAEYFTNISLEGNPAVVKNAEQIDFLWTLSSPDKAIPRQFYSARWSGKLTSPKTGTFKVGLDGNDGYRLFIDNTLLIDKWIKQSYSTSLVDFNFVKGKSYDVRVEFFEPVGNARLRLIWTVENEVNGDQKIAEAVSLSQRADVAVIVAGIHEGEFQDRAYLSLPGRQEELINKIAVTGKPVVVVLVGGSAITMNNWLHNVDAVLDVWYPGEEGGHAVADVLFGDYNPAGRLPITFPIHESQLPLVYDHKPTGRGDDYHNLSGLPLFPFGFGLSYSTFSYSNIKLDKTTISDDAVALVSFDIVNSGQYAGDEVCQLYITDVLASVARPVLELKGFQRVRLTPGEKRTLQFKITREELKMFDKDMREIVEPGEFRIMIGSSSRDIRLQTILTVENGKR